MVKLFLLILFFLLSLLTIFRAPINWLWYVAILVTEFSWVFFCIVVLLLLFVSAGGKGLAIASLITGLASLFLYALPIAEAARLSPTLVRMFSAKNSSLSSANNIATPFRFGQLFSGLADKSVSYQRLVYDSSNALTLDFYPAGIRTNKPCVVVVHGGSWAGGDSQQLPELNSALAKAGYTVASLNYRLAPQALYPAPVEDIASALQYLRTNASRLSIGNSGFVLLGRSAGGQIVLSAAYTLADPTIKGVISFYGPADMVWGYAYPTSPLVLDSRKVMADYLGGSYAKVPQQYVNSSATETATQHSVPTLLIHGENDPLVSPLHGVRLGKKLDSLGVPHYDVYLPWATHAFDWTLHGPGGQISTWCVMQFLERLPE